MGVRLPKSATLIALVVLPALGGCLNSAAPQTITTAASEGQLREFDMYIQIPYPWEPVKGHVTQGWAFGLNASGPFSIPGPEIRVTEGDHVRVRLHSTDHTLHWHGVSLPWAMDGVPYMTQTITAAPEKGMYIYDFIAKETGTYWYHCHVDAPTHIDLGLFGAFIVMPRDPAQDPPFDHESTLILGDYDSQMYQAIDTLSSEPGDLSSMQVPQNPADVPAYAVANAQDVYDIGGTFILPSVAGNPNLTLPGTVGPRPYYPQSSLRYEPRYDTFTINGKTFPDTEPVHIKVGETVRIRLINAGQLVHTMHLHGHHFLVTHKDGYPLPAGARYYADSLMLGPGERYDVYVKGDNIGIWDLHDHGGGWGSGAYAATDHAFPGGMSTMLVYDDFTYAKLPEPAPGKPWTSGDYVAFAPSYKGLLSPPDRMHHG